MGVEKALLVAALSNVCLGATALLAIGSVPWAFRIARAYFLRCLCGGVPMAPEVWDKLVLLSAQANRRHLKDTEQVPPLAVWTKDEHRSTTFCITVTEPRRR